MLRAQKGRAYAHAREKFSEHLNSLEHYLHTSTYKLFRFITNFELWVVI